MNTRVIADRLAGTAEGAEDGAAVVDLLTGELLGSLQRLVVVHMQG